MKALFLSISELNLKLVLKVGNQMIGRKRQISGLHSHHSNTIPIMAKKHAVK